MSRRASVIVTGLVYELAERLEAAGVTGDRVPGLEAAHDLVWPLAKALARLEKRAGQVADSARNARETVLDAAVSACMVPGNAPARRRFAEFDPGQWHVALVPGKATDPAAQKAEVQ